MHAVIVLWRISQLILVKTGRAVQELYYEQTVVEKVDKIKLMLLCVQAVTKDIQKTREEEQLSGYKQCYTYKNQSLKCPNV